MKPNPCKPDCPKRNAECHSLCPEYKKWRIEKDADNERINKNKRQDQIYQQHRIEYAFKCQKKRGAMK
jgi:hypothetical protein